MTEAIICSIFVAPTAYDRRLSMYFLYCLTMFFLMYIVLPKPLFVSANSALAELTFFLTVGAF